MVFGASSSGTASPAFPEAAAAAAAAASASASSSPSASDDELLRTEEESDGASSQKISSPFGEQVLTGLLKRNLVADAETTSDQSRSAFGDDDGIDEAATDAGVPSGPSEADNEQRQKLLALIERHRIAKATRNALELEMAVKVEPIENMRAALQEASQQQALYRRGDIPKSTGAPIEEHGSVNVEKKRSNLTEATSPAQNDSAKKSTASSSPSPSPSPSPAVDNAAPSEATALPAVAENSDEEAGGRKVAAREMMARMKAELNRLKAEIGLGTTAVDVEQEQSVPPFPAGTAAVVEGKPEAEVVVAVPQPSSATPLPSDKKDDDDENLASMETVNPPIAEVAKTAASPSPESSPGEQAAVMVTELSSNIQPAGGIRKGKEAPPPTRQRLRPQTESEPREAREYKHNTAPTSLNVMPFAPPAPEVPPSQLAQPVLRSRLQVMGDNDASRSGNAHPPPQGHHQGSTVAVKLTPHYCADSGDCSASIFNGDGDDSDAQCVRICGEGIGKSWILAVLLCDTPARVLRQSANEVLVLPGQRDCGLREPVVGAVEVHNTRDERLVFTSAFAYVPASHIAHAELRQQLASSNMDESKGWSLGCAMDITYLASKTSSSHHISLGFDELGMTFIHHWHTVFLRIDASTKTLRFKPVDSNEFQDIVAFSTALELKHLASSSRLNTNASTPLALKAFHVIVDRENRHGRPFCVSLHEGSRVKLTISAPTEALQMRWAAALQHAINGWSNAGGGGGGGGGGSDDEIADLLPPNIGRTVAATRLRGGITDYTPPGGLGQRGRRGRRALSPTRAGIWG